MTRTLSKFHGWEKPMPAISVNGVSHSFDTPDGGRVVALDDVDVNIEQGEFVAIVGPSGCGKTTVLNMLAGLEMPEQGSVTVGGQTPRAGNPDVGYVLARDCLLPWRTTLANAALALEVYGVGRREREQRARESLKLLGLAGFEDAYAAQLSHGMRQRVALARSFAAKPAVLLMDEPFSALDAQTRMHVQDEFLAAWAGGDMTVVLITHDLTEAVGMADRVVIMTRRPGRIKSVHKVDLPRPRTMMDLQGDDNFHQIYEAIWRDLREEVAADTGMEHADANA